MQARGGRTDICFVIPPFDSLRHTPLGVSTLVAACRARGFAVSVVYGSMLLAERIGFDLYDAIAMALPRKQPGEYLFKPFAYPPEVLATIPTEMEHPKSFDLIAAAAPEIGPSLDDMVAAIAERNARIVAITNMFQQNLAAFAIARRVQAELPDSTIVMGGANVTGVMADGLARVFDCVDYFFDGEADVAFPDFCDALLRQGRRPAERVVRCKPIQDMRLVPTPDFSDFTTALRASQKAGRLPPELPNHVTYESSRGCWWGAKHHCTFCGLNQNGMSFREKGAERVVKEIRALTEEWPTQSIRTADNIMPTSFFEDVLPRLTAFEQPPNLFYEVKANLKDGQLAAMRRAGIYSIQPGIESLSTPVLKLMRKGVSAQQNLMLLRSCVTHGVKVGWNFIYGFPGETAENYRDILALLPAIAHLQPPDGLSAIMIDRFSPYFDDHASFGIPSMRPFEIYRGLFAPDAPLGDIAYHFDGDYMTPLLDDAALVAELQAAMRRWQRLWKAPSSRPMLFAHPRGTRVVIADTRPGTSQKMTVLPREAFDALLHLERPRPREGLPAWVETHVDELLERRFLINHEGLLLSVVVRAPDAATAAEPSWRAAAARERQHADLVASP